MHVKRPSKQVTLVIMHGANEDTTKHCPEIRTLILPRSYRVFGGEEVAVELTCHQEEPTRCQSNIARPISEGEGGGLSRSEGGPEERQDSQNDVQQRKKGQVAAEEKANAAAEAKAAAEEPSLRGIISEEDMIRHSRNLSRCFSFNAHLQPLELLDAKLQMESQGKRAEAKVSYPRECRHACASVESRSGTSYFMTGVGISKAAAEANSSSASNPDATPDVPTDAQTGNSTRSPNEDTANRNAVTMSIEPKRGFFSSVFGEKETIPADSQVLSLLALLIQKYEY